MVSQAFLLKASYSMFELSVKTMNSKLHVFNALICFVRDHFDV